MCEERKGWVRVMMARRIIHGILSEMAGAQRSEFRAQIGHGPVHAAGEIVGIKNEVVGHVLLCSLSFRPDLAGLDWRQSRFTRFIRG